MAGESGTGSRHPECLSPFPDENIPRTSGRLIMNARRSRLLLCGFVAAGMLIAAPTARAAEATPAPANGSEAAAVLGKGPAYETVGKVAVMHEGRIKPLDTLAREEVKQIFGRESAIKLYKPAVRLDGKTRAL